MSTATDGAAPSVAPEPRDDPDHPPHVDAPAGDPASDPSATWVQQEIQRRIAQRRPGRSGRHARREVTGELAGGPGYIPRHSIATPGPASPAPGDLPAPALAERAATGAAGEVGAQPAGPTPTWSAPTLPAPSADPVPGDPAPGGAARHGSPDPADLPAIGGPSLPAGGQPVPRRPVPRAYRSGARGGPASAEPAVFGGPGFAAPATRTLPEWTVDADPDPAVDELPATDAGESVVLWRADPAPPRPQNPVPQSPVQQRPVQQRPVQQRPVQQRPVQQSPVQHRPVHQSPAPDGPFAQPDLDDATVLWAHRTPPIAPRATPSSAPPAAAPGTDRIGVPSPRPSEDDRPSSAARARVAGAGEDTAELATAPDVPTGPVVTTAAPSSTRVRVVLSERQRQASPVRTVVDIQEGGAVGELLRTDLIGSQLAVALRFAVGTGLAIGLLPVLFAMYPEIGRVEVLGLRLPWLLLGVLIYPFLLGIGWWHTRTAERIEQNFADHVQE